MTLNGSIHGDLRPCNILVNAERVKVIDFEKVLKHIISTTLKLNELNGALDGELITKEHDKYWIDHLSQMDVVNKLYYPLLVPVSQY